MSTPQEFIGTGRRKTAVASVRIRPNGTGKIDINGRELIEYFPREIDRNMILEPISKLESHGRYDMIVRVKGGGMMGQAQAMQLGLARALVLEDEQRRPDLKGEGFLTRDPRKRERKKYGLRGARKRSQYSKR